jgi:hypothetical protein
MYDCFERGAQRLGSVASQGSILDPQRDWYGLLVHHELLRVKCLGSKVAQLISNLIVPCDYETAALAFKCMANAKLLLAATALDR